MSDQLNIKCKKLADAYNTLIASRMNQLSEQYNVSIDRVNDIMNYYIS